MKKGKKRVFLAAALCFLLLFSSACSGTNEPDPVSTTVSGTSGTGAADTTAAAGAPGGEIASSGEASPEQTASSGIQADSTSKAADTPGTTAATTSKASSGRPGSSGSSAVMDDIQVASGTKSMEDGLNFGGKTVTFLIWSEVYDDSWAPMITAYESKFNCKVSVSTSGFADYLTALSTAISSGKPYDIVRMQGSLYPRSVITNLLEPMESGFTTADLTKSGNPQAGGIDLEKSKYFAWANKLYAVCEREAAPLQIMLYNKLKFRDDLGVDPLALYKNGEWTWDKIVELGQKVTKPENKVYFGDATFGHKMFTLANDAHMVKNVNGVLRENLLDANMFNALKYVQSIAYGNDAILTSEGSSDNFSLMRDGSTYMFCTETTKISMFAEQAASSQAFGRNADNLGVVPLPLGPDNKTGAYPANWLVGFSTCRTKDVKPAIAMLKFSSTWEGGSTGGYTMDSYVQAELDKFYDNINYCDFGFSTADTKLDTELNNIENRVLKGEDITKILREKQSIVQGVIDSCLDYQ